MDENILSTDLDKRPVFRTSLKENKLLYETTAQNSKLILNGCDTWGKIKKSRIKIY